MDKLKINGKELSEYKTLEELYRALEDNVDEIAKILQKDVKSTVHFLSGFSDMGRDFQRCSAAEEKYIFTLKTIDKLFGTDYANWNKIYGIDKPKEG